MYLFVIYALYGILGKYEIICFFKAFQISMGDLRKISSGVKNLLPKVCVS